MRLAVTAGLMLFLVLLTIGFALIAWNQYRLNRKPKPTAPPTALIELKPLPRIDVRV